MPKRSIRNRRTRTKLKKEFELQLTSMMDMLIILLVFLLKSYSTSTSSYASSNNIRLPTSTTQQVPADSSANLVIDPMYITLDGEKVVEFELPPGTPATSADGNPALTADTASYLIKPELMGDQGRRILPLYDALVKQREKAELVMSKAVWKDKDGNVVDKPKFEGALVIHADKAVRYELLRKIMYTAGAAQFKVFKLVTVAKEGT